jgi:hypothetical protein
MGSPHRLYTHPIHARSCSAWGGRDDKLTGQEAPDGFPLPAVYGSNDQSLFVSFSSSLSSPANRSSAPLSTLP